MPVPVFLIVAHCRADVVCAVESAAIFITFCAVAFPLTVKLLNVPTDVIFG